MSRLIVVIVIAGVAEDKTCEEIDLVAMIFVVWLKLEVGNRVTSIV